MGGNGSGRWPNPNNVGSPRGKPSSRWTHLPPKNDRPPPPWPYDEDVRPANEAEQKLWEKVWKKPQASMWYGQGYDETVARYVIYMLREVRQEMKTNAERAELRSMEDRLGLSAAAMMRMYWIVDTDVDSEQSPDGSSNESVRGSNRPEGAFDE